MYQLIEETDGIEKALGEFETIEEATNYLNYLGYTFIGHDDWEDQGDDVLTQMQFSLVMI